MFSDEERRLIEAACGPGWETLPVGKVVRALHEYDAAETARLDQAVARNAQHRQFKELVVSTMEARDATFASEVVDEVVAVMFGGYTETARALLADIDREMFVQTGTTLQGGLPT